MGDGEYGDDVIACEEHRALAREAATKGIVLLRNDAPGPVRPTATTAGVAIAGVATGTAARPILPFDPRTLGSVAVIGRLADIPNTGDRGSSRVTAPYVVTPLEGIRSALEPLGVKVFHDDASQPQRAVAVAAGADAVLVVAGCDYRDEGEFMGTFPPPGFEGLLPRPPLRLVPRALVTAARLRLAGAGALRGGGDRRSLTLRESEEAVIQAVAAANSRAVVVLIYGSAVLMERWRHSVPGILVLWYAGMEGGHALADIVLGRARPTGRLPFAIPTRADHLPPFDPDASAVEYGELHGQALLDNLGVSAAYPYGFGLTYQG
jgi:hypothetical protein